MAFTRANDSRLEQHLAMLPRLAAASRRLHACASADSIVGGQVVAEELRGAEAYGHTLLEVLREVIEGIQHVRALQGTQPSSVDLAPSQHAVDATTDTLRRLESINASTLLSACELYPTAEYTLVDRLAEIRDELVDSYTHQLKHSPELQHLLARACAFARSWQASNHWRSATGGSDPMFTASDNAISSTLVIAQRLGSAESEAKQMDEERIHVPPAFDNERAKIEQLRPSDVSEVLTGLSSNIASALSGGSSTDAPICLARASPFLDLLVQSYTNSLAKYTFDVKSVYKLTYVVGRVALEIAQKGFCKPAEESTDDGDGEDGGEIEGTGMGTGTGSKNVSSEIQEESQVEGLRGEEEEGGQEEKDQDDASDDAVSMDEDFDGQMKDGKEPDEGEEDGDQEEEDHDEHRGDVDPLDPGAVDEKFWGQEGGDDDKDGRNDEQVDGEPQQDGEKEDGAPNEKQGKKDNTQEENGAEEQQDSEQVEEGGEDPEDGEDGEMEEMPDEQEGADLPQGKQDEVNVQEGERLDLPDDLDLGDDLAAPAGDDMELDGNDEGDEGNDQREDGDDRMSDGDEIGEDEAPAATGATEEDAAEGMEPEVVQPEDDTGPQEQGQESSTRGAGGSGGAQDEDDAGGDQDDLMEQPNTDETAGQGAQREQDPLSANQPGEQDPQADPADGPRGTTGDAQVGDSGEAPPESRSLAEILGDIRRRRDEILGQREEQSAAPRDQAKDEAPSQVEYLRQDQEDQGQQALGPAREDDRQNLDNLNILDEDMRGSPVQPGLEEPDDDVEAGGEARDVDMAVRPETADRTDTGGLEDMALTQGDVQGASAGKPGLDDRDIELENQDEADAAKDKDEPESDNGSVALRELNLTNGNQSSEDLWRHYASLTSDLSYALCEQLRLILEPTLATRLQGDFRTGKRLNMRKIIPYIASEFTKDKIWLRRTKPSRREYQVLLSLDDSGSMADGHAVDLAFRTLALVSQAMTKLEVGQVSIARFGETVDILHPFSDTGFSDADGAKVIKNFAFKQRRTDVAALVERTLTYLAESRQKQSSSSSAADLWQLEIIISDGECQDHDRLRTLLRRALEERVMIVFIIVDSLHSHPSTNGATVETDPGEKGKTSILQMQKADFKMVNGAMQMEITRYLDSFPFEYYVVLRDVEALPGVLADTLRQWMARVSQSQE